MNISSGLSELSFRNLSSEATGGRKIYVWPSYRQDQVDRISRVTRHTEGNVYYTKATDEDREKIIFQYRNNKELHYSPRGSIATDSISTKPGMLFDALV